MKTFSHKRKFFAFIALANLMFSAVWAQPAMAMNQNNDVKALTAQRFSQVEVKGTVQLMVNKGQLLTLPQSATKVLIANPSVASFQMPSSTSLFVFAKKAGTTTLYALNDQDQVILATQIKAGFNLPQLTKQINTEIEGARVKLFSSTENGIIVRGFVKTPQQAKRVVDAIAAFTGGSTDAKSSKGGQGAQGAQGGGGQSVRIVNQLKVELSAQINIRVRIVEVARSLSNELGFSWEALLDNGNTFLRSTSSSLFDASTGAFAGSDVSNALLGGVSHGGNFAGVLSALSSDGLASILAEPNLTAMSGETAGFAAGGEVPIIITTNNNITIDYKQYGVIMRMTPTLLSPNRISLHIAPEVSDLSDEGAVELDGNTIPAFKVRRADTTVELASGQSFALAGMLRSNVNETINGVPGLREIPLLGHLFESSSHDKDETELVIIATAYVVSPTQAGELQTPGKGIKPLDNITPKQATAGYLF
ncbi:type II and III secretion system protein family protein [Vibrio sp. CAIM 722]|uniref:Type II and III secretion system protein family protein n=1 Tax=Vibrio eleionomae TaxID=2653505 RepID=A0A7X4LJ15_9VIBR|nr:type II and III secretion system protein family protein [Vibrio eleionomae]MZI92883.1 type II and III secretion system protein family protein [Vibrio eleionomae]